MKRKLAIILCTLASTLLFAVPGQAVFAEEETTSENSETGGIVASTNMMTAAQLPLGTKAFGTIEKGTTAWYAFTTSETPGSTYNITFVKTTSNSYEMYGNLYDEYGTLISDQVTAYGDGAPVTISTDMLQPNTTYYVSINIEYNESGDYSLIIKNPEDEATAYKIAGNIPENVETVASPDEATTAGTNQSVATELPLGAKAFGTIEKGTSAWYSFTTGETSGNTYNITFVKASPDSYEMYGKLYDEYGTLMTEPATAYGDGAPATINTNELQPNTTYYVGLNIEYNESGDYGLSIKSPDAAPVETPAEAESSEETDAIDLASLSDSLGDDVDVNSLSDSELEVLAQTQSSILHDLQKSFDDAGIDVNIDETTGRVTMDNSILFDYDDATLSDIGKAYLDGFIDVYTSVVLNDTYSGAISHIQIEGHTDSDGSYDYNQTLSEKRAASVAEYCISRDSRLAEVITTKGRSYDDLVYNDDGTINMTASRRVVFRFILDTTQN